MSDYGRHRIRWSSDAFEMQCDGCLAFLPITSEFWVPKHGLNRCRACYRDFNNARQRHNNRRRRSDPNYRRDEAEAFRIVRRANRDQWNEYRRDYYRANREAICARRRELYAARKAA